MRKIIIFAGLSLLILAGGVGGTNHPTIAREDLSLKAGPTEPGEDFSLLWLEAYVYPKAVKEERMLSLGVRVTSRVKSVTASFDFGEPHNRWEDKVSLASDDGMDWKGAYKIPESAAAGLHVVRYNIKGIKGSLRRTVEFLIQEPLGLVQKEPRITQGEAVNAQLWPLTVISTCAALAENSSRILHPGEMVMGVSKVPWYKVFFQDAKEGWVPAAMVKDPLEDYYLTGYEAFLNKNYSAAIEAYKNAVSLDPEFVKGYFWLAKSYYKTGDLDAASRMIKEALRLDERNMDSRIFANTLAQKYFTVAHAKFEARSYHEAGAAYQKGLELSPDSALAWIEMGKSYEKLGLLFEARSARREALKIDTYSMDLAQLNKIESKAPPPALADHSLEIIKEEKTRKGTRIEAALKSVVALTKSLGTPVVEKGWQAKKQGDKYLVRYRCEQGKGIMEAFEWLVDIDARRATANNVNAKLLMDRW